MKEHETDTVNENGLDNNMDPSEDQALQDVLHVQGMYQNWFLDYASYVILDRALPFAFDGLKPVQRRILHAMRVLEDGRYHKAANIIGNTMCYHPHGDAAIGDALVKIAQKDLLIDTQGNWGNPVTGDGAAASRYIEARLTKFALEVLFNEKTTDWQLSYDGRKKEPLFLPVKFPLLLAMGVEGIAVGLSTKILPHNFNELLKASIAICQGKKFKVFPDFYSGGVADFSAYKDGARGGKVRVRAVINVVDSKTLKISEIPFGATTTSVIDSILAANDKGKIKVKQVEDNTAKDVEILVKLPAQASPEQMIEALYKFTDCEISISPNCCIIKDNKPVFCSVSEVLKLSTEQTISLLKKELEIKLHELSEKLHFSILEKLFIEEKIYRKIEKCETWEDVLETIEKGLNRFKKQFVRDVTKEDIVKLTEVKIKRISKFDSDNAEKILKDLQKELRAVKKQLANITDYAIEYFKGLLQRYGKGRERKTKIDTFETVSAVSIAIATHKLYINRKEGFIGTSLKKDEYLSDCSALDEVIAFTEDGKFTVKKVADKVFVGKNIIHADLFKRHDERRIYHFIYKDGKDEATYAKRFNITSVTRDKEYDLTKGNKGSKLLHFSVNPDGESELVKVALFPRGKMKSSFIHVDFSDMDIKSRTVKGNLVTKHKIRSLKVLKRGASTLAAEKIWIDRSTNRLNKDERGDYLGEFYGEDKILVVYKNGACELTDANLSNFYSDDLIEVCKYEPEMVLTVAYYEGERKETYIKRFLVDEETFSKRQVFLTSHPKTKTLLATVVKNPTLDITCKKTRTEPEEIESIEAVEWADIKGYKALGTRWARPVKSVELVK